MGDALKSKVVAVGASATELLAAVEGGETIINGLVFGNVDGVNDATVEITVNKNGGGDVTILKDLDVLAKKATVLFGKSTSYFTLEDDGTNDTIDATASAASDVVAIISYIERTT